MAEQKSTPPARGRPLPTLATTSSPVVCRICHEDGISERLVAPCRCSGSMGLVHVRCLEKWLTTANKDGCELCRHSFRTVRQPSSLLQWLKSSALCSQWLRVLADVTWFVLLTTLSLIGVIVCAQGVKFYFSMRSRWHAVGLLVLAFVITLVYVTWLVLNCRYHRNMLRRWQCENQQVRLLQLTPRGQSLSLYRHYDASHSLLPVVFHNSATEGATCHIAAHHRASDDLA